MPGEAEDLNLYEAAEELANLPPLDDLTDAGDQDNPDDQQPDDEPEGESEESQEDGDSKPAKPAIDAPVSLNAEERARFAQLPEEAQRMLADVETRRARQVTEVTTNAANAQREAATSAASAVAEARQVHAQQLAQLATAYQPRQPNPADYGDNMQQYARDHAAYQYQSAQHQQLMQQIGQMSAEAESIANQQKAQKVQVDSQRLRSELPDWFDAEKGQGVREAIVSVALDLGYPQDLVAQADANDLLALNKALGWKRDSEKLKTIMDRQMQNVRAGKTAKPGVIQPQGQGRRQVAKEASARLAKSGSIDDAAAAIAAQLG